MNPNSSLILAHYNPRGASVGILPERPPLLPSSFRVPTSHCEPAWGRAAHSTGSKILPDFSFCFSHLVCFVGGKRCPKVSAARGSPAAWHHAESSLGSRTARISSGRVTLAAKWRRNCWSFCAAPSAAAPSHRLDPSQSLFNTNLTNRLLHCYRWLRHCWLSLWEGGEVFLPFLALL